VSARRQVGRGFGVVGQRSAGHEESEEGNDPQEASERWHIAGVNVDEE
jgi:hypothetical protein